jgi:hypothetical protein
MHLQNHVVWLRILKCSVKPYVLGPSVECYFNEFVFIRILTLEYDKSTVVSVWSVVVSRYVLGLPPRGGF